MWRRLMEVKHYHNYSVKVLVNVLRITNRFTTTHENRKNDYWSIIYTSRLLIKKNISHIIDQKLFMGGGKTRKEENA